MLRHWIVLLLAAGPGLAQADTLTVCSTSCTHSTIAGAILASTSGDEIEVSPGTWDACVAVPEGVTLRGGGATPDEVVLDGSCSTQLGTPALAVHGTVQSLRIQGGVEALRAEDAGATPVLLDVEVRGSDRGLTVPSATAIDGSGLDLRGVDRGVEVESTATASLSNLRVVTRYEGVGAIGSAGTLVVDGASLVSADGSTNNLTGVVVTGGVTSLTGVIVAGYDDAVSELGGEVTLNAAWAAFTTSPTVGGVEELPWNPSGQVADPGFASWPCPSDVEACDLHLRSTAGRWDPSLGSRVTDLDTSVLINAGPGAADASAEADPLCSRRNAGAYGGTAEASWGADTTGCLVHDSTNNLWFGTVATAAGPDRLLELQTGVLDGSVPALLGVNNSVQAGPGQDPVLLAPDTVSPVIRVDSDVTLQGFAIQGGAVAISNAYDSVAQPAGNVELQDLHVSAWHATAVHLQAVEGGWGIHGCTFTGSSEEGPPLLDIDHGSAAYPVSITDSVLSQPRNPVLTSSGNAFGGLTILDSQISSDGLGAEALISVQHPSAGSLQIERSDLWGGSLLLDPTTAPWVNLTLIGSTLRSCDGPALDVDLRGATALVRNCLLVGTEPSVLGDTAGTAPAPVLLNNNILGSPLQLTDVSAVDVRSNYFDVATGPSLLLAPGVDPSEVAYNVYWSDESTPTFADRAVDASNTECNAQVPRDCALDDLRVQIQGDVGCLSNAGDPSRQDEDETDSDAGAAGGPDASDLLDRFFGDDDDDDSVIDDDDSAGPIDDDDDRRGDDDDSRFEDDDDTAADDDDTAADDDDSTDIQRAPGCIATCGARGAGRGAGVLALLLLGLLARRRPAGMLALALLLPAIASAGEPEAEAAAVAAAEVVDAHCATVAAASSTQASVALEAVVPVLTRVSKAHDATQDPWLLYWRGVLQACIGQDERAAEDLQAFVDGPVAAEAPSLTADARGRLRRLQPDGAAPVAPPGPRMTVGLRGGGQAAGAPEELHPFGTVELGLSVGIVGPLRIAAFGRLGIGRANGYSNGEQLVPEERSILTPFGGGVLVRLGGMSGFEVGGVAQFAINEVTDQGANVLPGAGLILGGAIRLGASPLELQVRGGVGNLGELLHVHGGVGIGVALGTTE